MKKITKKNKTIVINITKTKVIDDSRVGAMYCFKSAVLITINRSTILTIRFYLKPFLLHTDCH